MMDHPSRLTPAPAEERDPAGAADDESRPAAAAATRLIPSSPPRRRLVNGALAALLVLAVAAVLALALAPPERPDVIGRAPGFTLTDQLGRPASSTDLRGKVVVANFIYTSCPDICPVLSLQMRDLQERLRREGLLGRDVQLLSFTVDPARDTPPVLRTYAERHGADPDAWRFVTGPPEAVGALITGGFYQAVQLLPTPAVGHEAHDTDRPAGAVPEVLHGSRFVLIDRDWRLRAFYPGDEFDVERVLRDIRALLR